MKTAIVYHSYHHGNTKKLVDAIAARHEDVTLINVLEKSEADLFKTKGAEFLGSYRANGHITWGPFAIGGGQKKGHPTQAEIDGAVTFYEGLITE